MTTLLWLLVVEILGLAAFPTLFLFLRWLPDRGFSLSPVFGLLIGTYLTWFTASLGLPFQPAITLILTILVFGGLNVGLFWWQGQKLAKQLTIFFRTRWQIVLLSQLAFVVAFFVIIGLRRYLPDIRYSEKFFDYSIYTGILESQTIPPDDTWLAGYKINYYYFGQFMMAYLTHLTRIEPWVVYNLFLATIYAMLASGALGLGYALFRKRKGGLIVGLLAVLFICLAGNPDSIRQLIAPNQRDIGYCTAPNLGQCYWWSPARIIYDTRQVVDAKGVVVKEEQLETINEFPAFSFILSDVHAHVIAYPFFLLGLALALNLYRGKPFTSGKLNKVNLGRFGLTAWIIGTYYFLNSWNYPVILVIVAAVLIWRETQKSVRRWSRLALWLLSLVIVSLAFYAPFLLTFKSFSGSYKIPTFFNYPILKEIGKNIGLVSWDKTSLSEHLLFFGFFEAPIIAFLALKLSNHFKASLVYSGTSQKSWWRLAFLLPMGLVMLITSQFFYSIGWFNEVLAILTGMLSLGLAILGLLITLKSNDKAVALISAWLGLLILGFIIKVETLGLLLVILMAAWALLVKQTRYKFGTNDAFCLMLLIISSIILIGLEFFYLRDTLDTRFNSIGKFYSQIWLILGIVAAYSIVRVYQATFSWKRWLRVGWAGAVVLILMSTLIYPLLAGLWRTNFLAIPQNLDGQAWLSQQYPGDYVAISWLKEQAAKDPKFRAPILEITGPDYDGTTTRVSTFSGFPALVGWVYAHEKFYRNYDPTLLTDLDTRYYWASGEIYRTKNIALTQDVLKKYGVKFVFVGKLERQILGTSVTEADLSKFARFMKLVYDYDGVQIYAFPG